MTKVSRLMFDKASSWPACRTQKAACWSVLRLVIQSCPTLYNPMDWSLPGSSVHGDSSGNNTGVGCHTLLQGNFPTKGLNTGLLYCMQIHHLSHQGSIYYSTILWQQKGFSKINNYPLVDWTPEIISWVLLARLYPFSVRLEEFAVITESAMGLKQSGSLNHENLCHVSSG